jgi:DNA-binding MarR family transcriptional regulator
MGTEIKGTSEHSDRPLDHLVSLYVARRELVPVLRRVVLNGENEVKLEEAETLLALFRAKKGEVGIISMDQKGYTGLRQIEAAQMLSQSQIHRRVSGLIKRGYLEEKLPRHETSAIKVRLTKKGEAFADNYWKNYKNFSSRILEAIGLAQRQAHLRVNDLIQHKILGFSKPQSMSSKKSDSAENLISLFAATKAIDRAISRAVVLAEDGISVERADLLVFLYTKRGDFTSFGDIERNLVHSFSPSRHLISRWIGEMGSEPKGSGFIKTRPSGGKRMEAAITQKGTDTVKPILSRYNHLAENLMADVSAVDQKAHLLVNQTIIDSIHPSLKNLVSAIK